MLCFYFCHFPNTKDIQNFKIWWFSSSKNSGLIRFMQKWPLFEVEMPAALKKRLKIIFRGRRLLSHSLPMTSSNVSKNWWKSHGKTNKKPPTIWISKLKALLVTRIKALLFLWDVAKPWQIYWCLANWQKKTNHRSTCATCRLFRAGLCDNYMVHSMVLTKMVDM